MIILELVKLLTGFFIVIIIIDYLTGGNMWKKIKRLVLISWAIITLVMGVVMAFLIAFKTNGKTSDLAKDLIKEVKDKFDEKIDNLNYNDTDDNGLIK